VAELDGPHDVFEGRRGFAAFQTLLPEAAGGHHEVWLEHVDDDAAVYLNGVLLARHQGRAEPFTVSLDAAWNSDGSNVLALVVQNRSEAGGILGDVIFHAFAGAGEALGREVTGWRMRGGLCDPDASGEWRSVGEGDGRPKYFRARFVVPDLAGRAVPVYRFAYDGLSRGQVWLNGHSLGRYPDRVMPGGLYLPECWLKQGENTLTVFDEEGSAPTRAALVVEAAASRAVWTLAA
jgi:beta-galactosidase